MKRLRILVLMHESLLPPESIEGVKDVEVAPWKTEYDVMVTLEALGHELLPVGVYSDLAPIREAIGGFRPHIVFNMMQEFHGVTLYDHSVVSYLELLRQRYTGCNPRGLVLAQDKALSKKILAYHRIPVPSFAVYPPGRRVRKPKRLSYPLIVKSLTEDASLGIALASIVHDDDQLAERVEFIHRRIGTDAIAETYIEGRELYVGLVGNRRLQTFPIWELLLTKAPEQRPLVATERLKWNLKHQEKLGVDARPAEDLYQDLRRRILRLCKRAYRNLELSGYARMDLRLDPEGRPWIIEANPNPDLSFGEDFAESAEASGLSYEELLHKILRLGLRYRAHWDQVE